MPRMQVRLTQEQAAALRRRAAAGGVSVAALIREVLDRAMDEEARWQRAERVFGAFWADASDVAENHDRYLPG